MKDSFVLTLRTLQDLTSPERMSALWRLLDNPLVSPKTYDAVERARRPFENSTAHDAAELLSNKRMLFVSGARDRFQLFISITYGTFFSWRIYLDPAALKGKRADSWMAWIKALCAEFPVLFGWGCLDSETEAKHSRFVQHPSGASFSESRGISNAEFERFLPGVYWLTLFGPELVGFFTPSKLRALPDTETEEWGRDQVAVRLREPLAPEDMEARLAVERRLADQLGESYFFDIEQEKALKTVPALAAVLADRPH